MQELEIHLAQPTITDWAVLMVGYVVIGGLALAGLWVFLAWKVVRSGRRGRGIAWARNALRLAGRQFKAYLIRMGFGAKVWLGLEYCCLSFHCLLKGIVMYGISGCMAYVLYRW